MVDSMIRNTIKHKIMQGLTLFINIFTNLQEQVILDDDPIKPFIHIVDPTRSFDSKLVIIDAMRCVNDRSTLPRRVLGSGDISVKFQR